MVRIPTPFPTALVNSIMSVFRGAWTLVAWRLVLIIVGAFIVFYLLSLSSTVAFIVAWVLVVTVLGGLIIAVARGLWNANFWSFRL